MLHDLPKPPAGKTGWPWTEASPQSSEKIPEGSEHLRISIVTPNYNFGHFLEETIRSVLLQGYPNLEYIIIDGGSTDNSVEIIKKYEPWLAYWVSEKDEGITHAINKGMEVASGNWINWLNSDDFLLPGALWRLKEIIEKVPQAQWVSGGRLDVDERSFPGQVCIPWQTQPDILGLGGLFFPQDATFIRRDFLLDNNLTVRRELKNIFDTVLYLEMRKISKPILTTAILSAMRWHSTQRGSDKENRRREGVLFKTHRENRSIAQRILSRLLSTRFHTVMKGIVYVCIRYGWLKDSRGWKAYVFNCWEYRWELVDPRFLL